MIAKELIDARWKIIVGGLLAVAAAIFTAYAFELYQNLVGDANLSQLPESLQQEVAITLGSYESYTWSSWFRGTGMEILAVLATFLGGSLIAGEVSNGTIFFLLSKPVSRERVLLTKYAVAAVVLLALSLLGGVVLLITAAVFGHAQNSGGMLLSALLVWLGTMFLLGLALLFSTIFDDLLRPIGLAVLVGALLGLPGLIPGWQDWNLTAYWTSLPAYLGQEFPTKEFAVSLIGAVLPVVVALLLFRRRAY